MSRFCSVLLAFSLLACEAKDTGDSLGSGASKTAEPAPPVPIKTPDHTEKTDPRNDLDMAIQEMRTSDDSPPRMGTLDHAEMLCKDASAMVAKRAARNPGVPDDWQSWWRTAADDDVIETRLRQVP